MKLLWPVAKCTPMYYEENENIRIGLGTFSLRRWVTEYVNKLKDIQNDIQVVRLKQFEAVMLLSPLVLRTVFCCNNDTIDWRAQPPSCRTLYDQRTTNAICLTVVCVVCNVCE